MIMVRDASQPDLSSMADLLLIVHQLHVEAHPEIYREITHDVAVGLLAEKLGAEDQYLRVAEVDSKVQGYCTAAIRRAASLPLLQPRQCVYLNEIVVCPERRAGGVGQALIRDLEALAWRDGITEIELDVGSFNSDAKAFFQSQGFLPLRERMVSRLYLREKPEPFR